MADEVIAVAVDVKQPPLPKTTPGELGQDVVQVIDVAKGQVGIVHLIMFSYSDHTVVGNLTVTIGDQTPLDLDVSGWGEVKRRMVSYGQPITVTLKGVGTNVVGKLVVDSETSEG